MSTAGRILRPLHPVVAACRVSELGAGLAAWCRYFLQPKGAVMAQLEEMVNGSDAELKKLGSNREVLVKATESLRSELTEIITSLRRG